MKVLFRNYGLLFFCVVTLVHLLSIVVDNAELRYVSKLLLMPVLACTVYYTSSHPGKYYIITALVFSFLGDLFLLLESRNQLFFIFGLSAFLITHVLYIIFFTRIKEPGKSLLVSRPYVVVLVLGYGTFLIYILYPFLGGLKIPVIIYAGIICSMLLCTFYVYRTVGVSIGLQYIAGALFFVISDSLLAVNKFYASLPFAGLLIMLTYCAAQYFIVRGFIKQEDNISIHSNLKTAKAN